MATDSEGKFTWAGADGTVHTLQAEMGGRGAHIVTSAKPDPEADHEPEAAG